MKQKIKILHLEDVPADAELIEMELKRGRINHETFVVPDKTAFTNALKNFSYDIILSDHSLASFDSSDALRMVRSAGITVPFILVTATMSDEFAAKIMKGGAQDYILKDRLRRLPASVASSVEKHRSKIENETVQIETDEEKKQLTTRLQLATRAAGIGIWDWDIEKDHLIWDDGMYRLYNMDSVQFGSVYEGWISRIHPEDKHRVNEDIQMALAGQRKYDTEFRVILDDASIRTIKATGIVELDDAGKPDRMIGANWDISLQRSTEEKLIKANRLYTFISQINQSIVRVKDEKVLFRTACDIAVEFGTFKMAWIGLFDESNKVINLVDQNGIPEKEMQQFKEVSLKTGGPQERVLNNGHYFVSNDIANDPRLEDWKPMATRYGFNSCIILPVIRSGNVIGTFNLYSGRVDFYDKEEIALLLEVIADISFALDAFEKEKVHRYTEKLLIQNEKLFRALIEKGTDMITLSTLKGRLLYGSPSITNVLGYTLKEYKSKSVLDFIHPDDIDAFINNRVNILENHGKSFSYQQRLMHKNGTWLWCEGTDTNMLEDPGIGAIVSNFRDISEKKISEQRLEFDKNNLDALINNTDDLLWSVDTDFNLITSNQPFSDILKFTAGHVVEKSDKVLETTYSPQQAEPYKKLYQRAFTGESFTEIVYNELPVDSWSEISYCPIRKGDEVIGAACHSRDITEKIKAEKQVIVNEKRFRALVENSADAVAVLSPDGSPLYVSPSIQGVLGYTEEEAMSLNMFAIMHPDDLANVEPVWRQMLAGCGPPVPVITCRIWHKNGAWRWMEGILTNLLQDASIKGIVNNFRDITEKKLAEEALLLTQFAIDSAGDAVFWMTADARIVKVNEAACIMLGYSQQEMIQLSVPDIDPYMDAKKWQVHYEELRQKGSLFFETIQQAKDGRLIPVEISANYIKFGDAEYNCAFSRDISERKIAEGNLIKSETKLKEAQAIAHIGNFEIDLSNYQELWSDEMYKLLGVTKGKVLPSTQLFLSFTHPDDFLNVQKEFEKCTKTFRNSRFDFRFIRKDGAMRYGYAVAKFEFNKSNKPVRLFGIFQDVTEVKLAEIERIKMVNDLILRNAELEQFGYIISHNLRAPVANIIGASSVLNDSGLTIEDKEMLNTYINESIIKLDDVVKDLNHILQVKADINDTKEIVHFSKLVDDIMFSIQDLVDKYNVKIKCDFSEAGEFLTLKPYLYSIFYNIISNSIKYRRQQVPCLIEIKSKLEKNKLELTFTDNGIGINLDKNRGDVFGLYKRFHSGIEGKGMGLFMVKTQVETLGGKISVKSAVDEGTEFTIEFEV